MLDLDREATEAYWLGVHCVDCNTRLRPGIGCRRPTELPNLFELVCIDCLIAPPKRED